LKGLGFAVHESSMAEDSWSVKLVVTLFACHPERRVRSPW
jgi:hypothetical protein